MVKRRTSFTNWSDHDKAFALIDGTKHRADQQKEAPLIFFLRGKGLLELPLEISGRQSAKLPNCVRL
jgi:hypothetical protein